jgi:hypothetical protein
LKDPAMDRRCIWVLETPSRHVVELVDRRFPLAYKRDKANGVTEKMVKTVGGGRLLIYFSPFQIRAEFWPKPQNRAREFTLEEKLAVMCGQHPHMGQRSLLRTLDSNTVRELILNVPFTKRTRNEVEFRNFLMRFTEGEEAVVDIIFLDQDDESFYDDELSLWFHVAPESMQACEHYVDISLRIEETEESQSIDDTTGETSTQTTKTLYALPHENAEHGTVYFHFESSTGLILVSGLGSEEEEERRSSFREPDVFKYFVDRLRERIQEARGESD